MSTIDIRPQYKLNLGVTKAYFVQSDEQKGALPYDDPREPLKSKLSRFPLLLRGILLRTKKGVAGFGSQLPPKWAQKRQKNPYTSEALLP